MEVLICIVVRNTWPVFRGRNSSRAYGILVINFGVILNYVLCWICLNGVGFDLPVIQRMEVHIINWWGLCHLGMSYLTPLTGSSTPLAISRSALPVYLFWYKLFNLHTILQDCELEYWARQSPLLCWQGLLVSSNQADLRSLTRLDSRNRLVKLVCV